MTNKSAARFDKFMAGDDVESFVKAGIKIISANAERPEKDLLAVAEMVALGIPRQAAYMLFHVQTNRYPPIACIYCEEKFRPQAWGRVTRPYCDRCGYRGGILSASKTRSAARRDSARSIANVAVKRGKLQRQPCNGCGAAYAEKHHPDYSKPLDVIWLCRPCHMDEHRRLKAAQ